MGDTTEALEFGWQLVCGAIQRNSEQEWCEWSERSSQIGLARNQMSVWILKRLILMSFVKISPLVPWETPQELWNLAG